MLHKLVTELADFRSYGALVGTVVLNFQASDQAIAVELQGLMMQVSDETAIGASVLRVTWLSHLDLIQAGFSRVLQVAGESKHYFEALRYALVSGQGIDVAHQLAVRTIHSDHSADQVRAYQTTIGRCVCLT